MVILAKLLAVLVVGGGAVAGGTGAVLTLNGTPTPCVDRVLYPTSVDSVIAYSKWEVFKVRAERRPVTVRFTETEMTSVGAEYLGDRVKNFQVHFCPRGYAEATGTANGIDFLVKGNLDLTGSVPKVQILGVEAGNLPGMIPIEKLIPYMEMEDTYLDLGVNIASISYNWPRPGIVQIVGAPD